MPCNPPCATRGFSGNAQRSQINIITDLARRYRSRMRRRRHDRVRMRSFHRLFCPEGLYGESRDTLRCGRAPALSVPSFVRLPCASLYLSRSGLNITYIFMEFRIYFIKDVLGKNFQVPGAGAGATGRSDPSSMPPHENRTDRRTCHPGNLKCSGK